MAIETKIDQNMPVFDMETKTKGLTITLSIGFYAFIQHKCFDGWWLA